MYNKATIVGRLGQDPEIRYTQDGKAVSNLSIATSESYNDKNGQRQEVTEWHRVVVFGKTAENVGQYLGKGRMVLVEGPLQTRSYEDKEGQTRYVTEIRAQRVVFMPDGKGGGGQSGPDNAGDGPGNDDIPF